MKRPHLILAAVFALGVALPVATAADPGTARQRAYVDPASGEFVSPPPDAEHRRRTTADNPFADLQISAGQSAAGGIRVEHGESSYHELRARTSFPGRVDFECIPRR